MLPGMFAMSLHVPGRCYKLRKLTLLLLCKLDPNREAYGNDDTATVSFSAHGRKVKCGILGGTISCQVGIAMAVINFGSINIDHIYSVPHFVAPGETLSSTHYQSVLGGKGANQSIACALAGAQTKHVGAINKTDLSFLKIMEDVGVDCELVEQSNCVASGHAIIQVNEEAENAIVLFAGANHTIKKSQIENVLGQAAKDDWVLLQNETNAIADIINSAHTNKIKIAFNPAPMTPEIATLPLNKVDLLFVNEIEAMQLSNTDNTDDASEVLAKKYPNTRVIMTLGKAGVRYLFKGNKHEVSGFKVAALDTTAAGDTFTGYFLANYLEDISQNEHNPSHALELACAAAALCVSKKGAAPSIPTATEVQHFLNSENT